MPSLPSYINPALNLEPPPALEHADQNDSDSDDESDRYELVTFRIPVSMKVSELNGVQLDLHALSKKSKTSAGIQVQDGKYVVRQGDSNENASFRVLVPDAAQDNDSDSDDDDGINSDSDASQTKTKKSNSKSNYLLHPSRKAFSRHFTVCANVLEHKTEAELAPLKGPEPTNCTLKHSYSHIPQRQGLKRRWMPLGNPQGARAISPDLISLKTKKLAPVLSDNDNDNDASVQEPKIKTESAKKRRRSNSHASHASNNSKASPKKKKKSSKAETPKSEKRKKAKKAKKQHKQEEDALSV